MDNTQGEPTVTPPPPGEQPAVPDKRERPRNLTRIAVAGGVAALGLSIGGIAVATADDDNGRGPFVGRFVDGHDHPFADELASRLAESLDLDEDEVADALEEVRDELDPRERPELEDGELPAPPTEEERQARQAELAAALAAALDVEAAEVEAALEEIRADIEAQLEERFAEAREAARDGLVDRLDAAVEEGTLTEADKESVLKAYDEGVLDGPGLGRFAPFGHGPFGPGGPFELDDDDSES